MYKFKKFSDVLSSKKFILTASFIGLFLISVGLSLLVFYLISPKSVGKVINKVAQKSKFNLSLPKTEECPINGQKYTKPEADVWNSRRPIIQMIENHVDARPESGLSRADVVYEAVAEGGITRFAAVFYCAAVAEDVKTAPLRSARVYFINLAAGYGKSPLYLHQGEANNICNTCPGGVKPRSEIDPTVNALTLFDKLGWQGGTMGNRLDGGYNIGFPMVARNQYRLGGTPAAWEHSVVADLDLIWQEADKRGLGFKDKNGTPWTQGFKKWPFQDGKTAASASATDIKFNFWESMPGYDVEWKYNSTSNSYKRFNGGKEHIDWEFDKPQLTATNVAVMFVKETGPLDTEHHMFYQVIGTGKAIVFQNGEAIQGTWSKASALDREVFYDTNGKEIKMVRGTTWVEVLPIGNPVTY
ncbi:MAG: DUF3048 domain-containing protein [Candidatus Woesebacteria bacterium]|nr:MAG: DUF3048 domain-containing protein [Candidatus Woesebacteria bacterium]